MRKAEGQMTQRLLLLPHNSKNEKVQQQQILGTSEFPVREGVSNGHGISGISHLPIH